MAGEDLRKEITFISHDPIELINAVKTNVFSKMKAEVSSILCNDHDKVFFIIIDPNETEGYQVEVIPQLLRLFNRPENEEVMHRVRAIHFIVTKADTLQGNRKQTALDAVHNIVGEALCDGIVDTCRKYGINWSKDKKKNGRPRVFPFSLGRFYPGNIYSGDGADAETIIKVIADYVVAMQRDTPGRKLRRKLTKPIFK